MKIKTVIIATVCALMAAMLSTSRSYVGATGGHAAAGGASLFEDCQQYVDQIAQLEADKAGLQKDLENTQSEDEKKGILAQIKKLNDEIDELNSELHDCQYPKAPPPTANLLEVTGSSTLKNVGPTGGESCSLTLNVKNLTSSTVMITRAELFTADAGGWAYSQGDMFDPKGLFGGYGVPPTLPGNANYPNLTGDWGTSNPVEYLIVAIEATSGAQRQELISQIPINRPGFANVAPLPAKPRAFIGLQEPVEVITLANGKKWLTIIGQVIKGTSDPAALMSWKLSLRDSQNTLIWSETNQKFFDADLKPGSFDGGASINRFLYGFELPDGFTQGKLTIESDFMIGAYGQNVIRQADVNTAPTLPVPLQSPVHGVWQWGNGPGVTYFTAHNPYSEARYAYDLGMFNEVNGKLQSFDGDPTLNESYFCWNQPIVCAEEGDVIAVKDDVVDNAGNLGVKQNSANPKAENAYVVVGHDAYLDGRIIKHKRFSIYVHVRKDSAVVFEGQHVFAGELLARVGNAGMSGEPHLHFTYITIDSTGHPRGLPMQFNNLFVYAPGIPFPPVTGVPINGVQYTSQ
jgi:murein DD-endopeptidase MepM/ murein hydrolase activator NlpD